MSGVALGWIGTALGIAGALLLALNIPASPWGFVLFTLSSSILVWSAERRRLLDMMVLQGFFLVINLIGVWQWLLAPR